MKLYKHQIKMISEAKPILNKYNLVYIAAETRTGKTLSTIFLLKDDYQSILVITKKKAISSWNSDLSLANVDNFTVINYEAIHKLDHNNYDVIVLDESHSLGSYPKPSVRAKNIKAIAKGKKIVYLSATPSAETFSQVYHQLWISSYTPFEEKNFYKWYKHYGEDDSIMIQGRRVMRYKAAYADMILENINHLIVNMTKVSASFDVIVKEQKHFIGIDSKYIDLLNYFEKNRVIQLHGYDVVAETVPATINKLHQLSGGTLKIDDKISVITSLHKVKYIQEHLSKDDKIVILCNYIKERDLLLSNLVNSTNDVEKFKYGNYKYFVGHIKTFSEGVDFSYANSMIIYSLNFSATTYLQSRERLANKKRVKPIVVHYLFTKDTLDEYIYEAVSNKINFTSKYYQRCK